MVDKFIASGFVSEVDKTIREVSQSTDEKRHLLLDRANEDLNGTLVPFSTYQDKLRMETYKEIRSKMQSKHLSKAVKEEEKQRLLAEYNKKIPIVKKLYQDVADGKASPDALKLYLDPAAFNILDQDTYRLYKNIESASNRPESDEYSGDYRDALEPLKETLKSNGGAVHQDKSSFVHFKGKTFAAKSPIAANRYYITCKPNGHTQMVKAWNKAIAAHPEVVDNIHFKMFDDLYGGGAQDNIVIYLPKNIDKAAFDKLMNTFRQECGDDVLEDTDKMTLATKIESKGISKAPEFPMQEAYRTVMSTGLYDKKALEKIGPRVDKNFNNIKYSVSYNAHITKMLYLSVTMVRKRHNLKPTDPLTGEGKDDLLTEVKQNFNDLVRLSGVNPADFSRDYGGNE